jgi:nucleoside-diphosphate-sugar epimerase
MQSDPSIREPAINPLADDLDYILDKTRKYWEELRDKKLFITGGTGFFGCWLLESFVWINRRLRLNAEAWVLTRNPEAFAEKCPHLARDSSIKLYKGNIVDFTFPPGTFTHVIHAATEASARLNEKQPLVMFDTIVEGTRRTLDFARHAGTEKFLLTSSGAVYGRQPPELLHISEEFLGAPDTMDPHWIYGEGKRCAELLCATYHKLFGIETKIARCWAFVGPYLPIDQHFAIGNFIRDGIAGGPLRVNGDGTPIRSYQYAADLSIWLWTILFKAPANRPYNVGSDRGISIADLAGTIAAHFQQVKTVIAGKANPAKPAERYVPSIHRAAEELGLTNEITIDESISKTIKWHKQIG